MDPLEVQITFGTHGIGADNVPFELSCEMTEQTLARDEGPELKYFRVESVPESLFFRFRTVTTSERLQQLTNKLAFSPRNHHSHYIWRFLMGATATLVVVCFYDRTRTRTA